MPIRDDRPARPIRLRLAEVAQAQGITTVPDLARKMGGFRQSLYEPWAGKSQWMKLSMYQKLLLTLSPDPTHPLDPGDWFTWRPGANSDGPTLHWQVSSQAEARDISRTDLHYASRLHQSTIGPMWDDTGQAFYFDTLARVATALDVPGHPFRLGALLVWDVGVTQS